MQNIGERKTNNYALGIAIGCALIAAAIYFTFGGKAAAQRQCTEAARKEAVAPNPSTNFPGDGGGFNEILYNNCMSKRGY